MKIFFHLTIAIATAGKFGKIQQKSFLKHHHNNTEKTRGNSRSYQNIQSKRFQDKTNLHRQDAVSYSTNALSQQKSFDQLTWLLMKYKNIEAQFDMNHKRSMYNKYFTTYVSKLQKRYQFQLFAITSQYLVLLIFIQIVIYLFLNSSYSLCYLFYIF